MTNANDEMAMIRGEFFSDGKKFVFRLAGTPFSGVGDSASEAFDDLMRVDAQSAPLSILIREQARELEGETIRATIIRMVMIGLIVFAVLAGTIVGTAAVLPRMVSDIGHLTFTRMEQAIDDMTPDQQAQLSRVTARINAILDRGTLAPGCEKKPAGPQQ